MGATDLTGGEERGGHDTSGDIGWGRALGGEGEGGRGMDRKVGPLVPNSSPQETTPF